MVCASAARAFGARLPAPSAQDTRDLLPHVASEDTLAAQSAEAGGAVAASRSAVSNASAASERAHLDPALPTSGER